MAEQGHRTGFPGNGSRIGRRIRKLDWSHHPLGPIGTWDAALRASLDTVLCTSSPTFLVWGPDLTLFFNDAYEPMLGQKAHSLGSPYPAVWHEVWDRLAPYIHRVLAGESFFFENYATTLERRGHPEQAWFTFSYSPLRDHAGAVRGLVCSCVEVTCQVQALAGHRAVEEVIARLPARVGTNEERIRRSSEAITHEVRRITALVDALAGGAGGDRPLVQAGGPAAPSAVLGDNIPADAASAAAINPSAPSPDQRRRPAPNEP